ncbi:MAG: AAA family ATPase, partial [Candidatus Ornithomonoglobus sp.]
MYIKKLTLKGFRNYENAELEFSPLTNVIYGNNAQGKTNILEAVYLFA